MSSTHKARRSIFFYRFLCAFFVIQLNEMIRHREAMMCWRWVVSRRIFIACNMLASERKCSCSVSSWIAIVSEWSGRKRWTRTVDGSTCVMKWRFQTKEEDVTVTVCVIASSGTSAHLVVHGCQRDPSGFRYTSVTVICTETENQLRSNQQPLRQT